VEFSPILAQEFSPILAQEPAAVLAEFAALVEKLNWCASPGTLAPLDTEMRF
jgi:hypothetical protein